MITRTERQIVEFLKRAKRIKITEEGECGTILELKPSPVQNSKKLKHDLALAFQDYFNNAKRR